MYLISLHHIIIKEPGEKIGIRGPQGAAGEPSVGYQFFDREGEARGVVLSSIRNNSHKNRYFNIRHENRIKVTFLEIKK